MKAYFKEKHVVKKGFFKNKYEKRFVEVDVLGSREEYNGNYGKPLVYVAIRLPSKKIIEVYQGQLFFKVDEK